MRARYLALLVATIALGLASRRYGELLPGFVATYAGDTLWAAAAYWALAVAAPTARPLTRGIGAAAISLAVELSQLYHAPWIDALRATRPGALLLGYGFLWSDLACYAVGVGLALLLDRYGILPSRFEKPMTPMP
ncbi:MAG: DUF2809 domain-containing protein [Gemmatimonadaceae bacterium]